MSIPTAPTEAQLGAIVRLAHVRQHHKDLLRAEANARLNLVAAIIAMDATEDQPGRHNLQEQAAVEEAKEAYAQALADLVRGEAGSCE